MKKFVATLSALSLLSLSVVPTMAKGNDHQEFNGQKIKGHFHTTTNITLSDINGHWAEKYIKDLIKKGVLSGVDQTHFSPNASVSRAQWAVMVSRYFGLTSTATTQDFGDVPVKSWAYPYVEASKDYFDAFRDLNGNLQFHPNAAATRQDVTVTLVKILAKLDPSIEVMSATEADTLLQAQFSDWNQIISVLRPYVATAVKYDLIHGDGKGHFLPLQSLSRAQAATMLDLLLDTGIVVDDGGTTNPTDPSHVTVLTTSNNAVITSINNSTHALTVETATTVSALKTALSVDSGKGTVTVYTDSTKTTVASGTATVTSAMVLVATAQDGTTKTTYQIQLTTPLSTVTTLTTKSNTVVTHIDNAAHELDAAGGTTVQTLKNNLAVDSGQGTVAVYTDNTLTTQAATSAKLTNTMVLVATAQDGVTKATYTINVPTPPRTVTTLTTSNAAIVTGINNTFHALTIASGTTVKELADALSVDNGKGTVTVYTDTTKTTVATDTTSLTNQMIVVATAEDGTTKASYTITL